MKVYNSTQNNIISEQAKMADNFFLRSIGLILEKHFSEGKGLIIKPCCSIHTFFMKFNIDILFINKNNEIIALYENVKPWRILPIHATSSYVIELPSKTISDKNICKNDLIKIIRI